MAERDRQRIELNQNETAQQKTQNELITNTVNVCIVVFITHSNIQTTHANTNNYMQTCGQHIDSNYLSILTYNLSKQAYLQTPTITYVRYTTN